LRRWVISLLRPDESTTGAIDKKRLQAAWHDETRKAILGLLTGN
jgi:hypothetical protein